MTESVNRKNAETVNFSPETCPDAGRIAGQIIKESYKFIQRGQSDLIPTDQKYYKIVLVGEKELEADGKKDINLIIKTVSFSPKDGVEGLFPVLGESFSFFTTGGGYVLKETYSPYPKRIEKHRSDKEELDKLLNIIKGCRGIGDCIVP